MGISSGFKFDIINKKYLEDIQNEFCRFLGFDIHVNLVFTGAASASDKISTIQASEQKQEVKELSPVKEDTPNDEKEFMDYKFEYA